MTKTLRKKFIEGLIKQGETEVKRTSKSIVFTRKAGGYYYIGKSGSLRFGQNKLGSIPCSSKFKCILMGIENTI